jgi:hypothetical protein
MFRVIYHGSLFDNKNRKLVYPVVDIDGDNVVVGTGDTGEIQFSSAVFDMQPENVTALDFTSVFSVAISGDHAFAGAYTKKDKVERGGGYLFKKDSLGKWSPVLHIDDPYDDQQRLFNGFGTIVHMDGDILAIDHGTDIFIYRLVDDTWMLEANLTPVDSNLLTSFDSISVKEHYVAVGRFGSDYKGAVFVYTFDPSSQLWILLDGPISNHDCDRLFGSTTVLVEDGGLLIGCPGENDDSGAVYFYSQSGTDHHYEFQQKITLSDVSSGDRFGSKNRLAADGNIMLASTFRNAREIHVFALENNTWKEVDHISAPIDISEFGPDFGERVAFSGRNVLVSSKSTVYSFTLDDC